MPVRRRMRAAPDQLPAPVVVTVAGPVQRVRLAHRETRPCSLPGCTITWIPVYRPVCDMHWVMLPWMGRVRWDVAYRKKLRKVQASEFINLIIYLLVTMEQDSVPMPEGHQYGAAAGWECPCYACMKIRERAKCVAAERYPLIEGVSHEHRHEQQVAQQSE